MPEFKDHTGISFNLSIIKQQSRQKTYIFMRTISDTAKAKRALCFSKAVSSWETYLKKKKKKQE